MTGPKRIHRRRTKGWRMPAGAVNVTRPSDWGNPFRIGDELTYFTRQNMRTVRITLRITPALAVALFREWVTQRDWVEQIRAELAGRDLACWCPLDQPCHADVLLELANSEAST